MTARPLVNVGDVLRIAALGSVLAVLLASPVLRSATDSNRPAGLENVGFDQKLNDRIPLNLTFHDEAGQNVRLASYFGQAPVILVFNYYSCPMLCPLELNDVLRAIRAISLDLGRQFQIVTVSIDPHDTPAQAAEKKQWYAQRYGRPGGARGWHFLTGDAASIESLAHAAGYRYSFDQQSGQFAHAAGLAVLTPDGRLAKYLYGLEYSPRDLRLALVEASNGRIGSLTDQVLLFCFHYDPESGRYDLGIIRTIRAAGIATVLGMSGLVLMMFRRERTRHTR